MFMTSAREIEMTYTATIQNDLGTATLAEQKFPSVKKAKEFVRAELGADHPVAADSGKAAIITDDDMETRHIKAWVRFGKINWGGDCPRAWYRA
jgi:hypothetical protein